MGEMVVTMHKEMKINLGFSKDKNGRKRRNYLLFTTQTIGCQTIMTRLKMGKTKHFIVFSLTHLFSSDR